MTEVIRRVFWVVCLLGAIAAALSGPGPLLRVRPADFARDWERKYSPPTVMGGAIEAAHEFLRGDEPFVPLAAFIEAETRGRVLDLPAEQWTPLMPRLEPAPVADEALYLPLTEGGPGARAAALMDARGLGYAYLELATEAGTRSFGLAVQRPSTLGSDVPTRVRFPYRHWAWQILMAGLALYFVLPRRQWLPGSLRYGRLSAGILPDLGVATPLTAVFFSVPFLVVPDMSDSGNILDFADGSGWLTLVFWGMSCFGLAAFAVAAWYSAYELLIRPDGLQIASLRGERVIRFAQVERVEPMQFRLPRWLDRLLLVGSFFSWRVASQYLIVTGRQDPGLKITLEDGSDVRIRVGHLPGGESILPAFHSAGVSVVTPDEDPA